MTTTGPESAKDPFREIDPKLTIYALANGLDLLKSARHRRLSWYENRRERGMLILAPEDRGYRVLAAIWKQGEEEPILTEELTRVQGSGPLLDSLDELVELARERASLL